VVVAVRTEESDGGLVVVKEARSDGDVARLTVEAAHLARCRHPGVVDLLAVGERSITLRHAGTALARLGPFPLDQAAGIVCAVADVVQAIHRLGIVHGDLGPEHVLLDDRGRPRVCGFGRSAEHTPEGAADDVAALGRLLGTLVRAGADLPWANPPRGLHRRAEQRQARRDLEAIAAQATREQRSQRPTARQLAKAVHAAVPGCSLPVPSAAGAAQPAFAEIPADIDPTADLGWTSDDLSWLASDAAGADLDLGDDTGAYDDLRALSALSLDDAPDDWAELAANPEAVTGPLPVLELDEEPVARARIALDELPAPVAAAGPTVELPARSATSGAPRRRPLAWVATLVVLLVVGVAGGVAAARAVRPADDADLPTAASREAGGSGQDEDAGAGSSGGDEAGDSKGEVGAGVDAGPGSGGATGAWPASCDLPSPAGPDVDGDGCPEPVELDGRTATVGTVTVALGQEGDAVALGDWDCDGTATPALLRPETGEVFVFPRWSLDEPLEVPSTAVVPDATQIRAGEGDCPPLLVSGSDGERTIPVPR